MIHMATRIPVQIARTTRAVFDQITNKDSNKIYFLTDTKEIYVGSTKYAGDTDLLTKIIESTTDQVTFAKTLNSEESVVVPTKEYIDTLVGELDTLVTETHSLVEDKIEVSLTVFNGGSAHTTSKQTFYNYPGETIVLTVPEIFSSKVVDHWEKYYNDDYSTVEVIPDVTSRSLEIIVEEQKTSYNVWVY